MIGVYKITSPTKKVYIGQSIDIEKRIETYSKYHNGVKSQIKLYNSIKKYGWETHIFEIIEECNVELLNNRERYWQDYYNVLSEYGLNCKLTTCAEKSGQLSETTKTKISNSLMGHEVTEKTKRISSLRNKGNQYCLGYKHKEEFLDTLKKIIYQYDTEGNFIREWSSLTEAAASITSKKNNLKSKANSISNCLNNRTKTGLNFIWKLKRD